MRFVALCGVSSSPLAYGGHTRVYRRIIRYALSLSHYLLDIHHGSEREDGICDAVGCGRRDAEPVVLEVTGGVFLSASQLAEFYEGSC